MATLTFKDKSQVEDVMDCLSRNGVSYNFTYPNEVWTIEVTASQ